MRKPKQSSIILLCFSAWILRFTSGCSEPGNYEAVHANGTGASVTVTVSEIKPWEQGLTRRFPGVVRPERRAALSTRVSGTIHAIRMKAGDRVETGDELARVESRDMDALVAAAESSVKSAETAHDQAVRDADRLHRLAEEDLIARNRLEHARVTQQEAASKLEEARAALHAQEINRSYAHIIAPFGGIVSEVLIDEGSFAGPGQTLLILEDRSTLRIDVPVSARIADQVTADDEVSILSPLISEPLSARYRATVPALDNASAGQIVRFSLDDPPPTLQPGQVVDVLLYETADKDWVALPRSALIRRGQLTGTLVLEKQQETAKVRLRWIRTVDGLPLNHKNGIPVSQGLDVGEFVVLHPSTNWQDGQTVQLESRLP